MSLKVSNKNRKKESEQKVQKELKHNCEKFIEYGVAAFITLIVIFIFI